MARILSPRERKIDGQPAGLFHMTVHSDEEKWCYPIGPCAENCPGHATAEEAYRHYQEGKITKVRLDGFDEHKQKKCAVCGAWTQKAACVDGEIFEYWPLCDQHLNIEEVTKILLAVPDKAAPKTT